MVGSVVQMPHINSSSTFICSSSAVRREMRCVRLGFVTVGCPSFTELFSCTMCWASSSQRRRSSVGWSAGTMPWSGASWKKDKRYISQRLQLQDHFGLYDWKWEESRRRLVMFLKSWMGLPHSRTAGLHEAPYWDPYWAVQAQALWWHTVSGGLSQ